MTGLDKRQLKLLKDMGIEVWQSRQTAPTSDVETSRGVDLSIIHQHSDMLENLAENKEVDDKGLKVDIPSVNSLQDIEQSISQCQKCSLFKTRTKTVPGKGNSEADWMFVGEAPGYNEDLQGQPFVGRAGQLLDAMIKALGMKTEQAFIVNVLKCRPPNNRDPESFEVEKCEPYLHQQLSLVKPKAIVALGRISAQALLKSKTPLGQLRGQVHYYGAMNTPLIVTYHPAYLLRSPQHKSRTWEDLLLARSVIGGPDS